MTREGVRIYLDHTRPVTELDYESVRRASMTRVKTPELQIALHELAVALEHADFWHQQATRALLSAEATLMPGEEV